MSKPPKEVQNEVRIMPSHPDFEEINLLMTMLAMLKNPQAHFHTHESQVQKNYEEILDGVSELDREFILEQLKLSAEKEREELIAQVEARLIQGFAKAFPGLQHFSEFLATLDQETLDEKIEKWTLIIEKNNLH